MALGATPFTADKIFTMKGRFQNFADGPFGPLRLTQSMHYAPAAYINGVPVSAAGLEQYAILSDALGSIAPVQKPEPRSRGRR